MPGIGFVSFAAAFTRPANTTAYASGQLVANSTAAGSVVPALLASTTEIGTVSRIDRVRLRKSGTSLTNASYRLHFYSATVVPSNGDGAAWLTPVGSYIGACDVTVDRAFSDGAEGAGVPLSGSAIVYTLSAAGNGNLYALIEARAAYTPVSAETFTVIAEGYRL